jgi:hypothetical protein
MGMNYKILHGYDGERFTPITDDELEKAYGLFLLGGRGVFKEGAVDSKYIQAIIPDWHAIMGWNEEYKLTADDYAELRETGMNRKARELQSRAQERVQYLINAKQENLIGTNTKIPELDKPSTQKYTENRYERD